MVFGSISEIEPKVYVNEILVPVCDKIMYLGHLISNNESDSVNYGITKFNSSFNMFMSSFGKCYSSVKSKLFTQYCTSFYGSQLWPLKKNNTIDRISIRWRIALRKIWNLPFNAHCDLLPLVSNQLPLDIQLKCRFIKFYRSISMSKNNIIKYISQLKTFSSQSTMSSNLNQILYDLNLDIFEIEFLTLKQIKELYNDKWLKEINNLYPIHARLIYDISMFKERILLNKQERQECDYFIHFFSIV